MEKLTKEFTPYIGPISAIVPSLLTKSQRKASENFIDIFERFSILILTLIEIKRTHVDPGKRNK